MDGDDSRGYLVDAHLIVSTLLLSAFIIIISIIIIITSITIIICHVHH